MAAYSRLASRSQAKFHTMKLSPLVGPCAAAPAQTEHHIRPSFTRFSLSGLFSAGQVGGFLAPVPYMKIPVNNQVICIKNVVAVAAYRSCRLWSWVKMPWIHYVLCNHHWTQCRHALSNTSHVTQIQILEHPRRPPKRRCQDVRKATWQLYAHEAESARTSWAVTRSYWRSAWV